MPAPTSLVYDESYLHHKTLNHIESPLRLQVALGALESLGVLSSGRVSLVKPRKAAAEELRLIHDASYMEDVRLFCAQGGGLYDHDTYLSPETYEVALMAAGGVLKAGELVSSGLAKNAFCLLRPPGHHAGFVGKAMGSPTNGFCVFNNAALCAAHLLARRLARRVCILDFDVHHGNGTQEVFNRSEEVLYISLHERGIYPFTGNIQDVGMGEGEGFKINIPFPPGAGNSAYLEAFDAIVSPVMEEFDPGFVVVSAGFDAHHSDRISSTVLSSDGYRAMMAEITRIAEEKCDGKIVACLEGGYSREALAKALPTAVGCLAGIELEVQDEQPREEAGALKKTREILAEARRVFSRYWRL